MMKWVGCYAALVTAIGLIIGASALVPHPVAAITLACLAMVALFAATWQYNRTRFKS